MRLIVDTNRIIAALLKDSVSRRIILHRDAELISIDFSFQEIEKHKRELLEKMRISLSEFNLLLEALKNHLVMLNDAVVQQKMNEAKNIMDKIDPDDAPFVAAALATKAEIWSDDAHFQKQKKIKVWTTREMMKRL